MKIFVIKSVMLYTITVSYQNVKVVDVRLFLLANDISSTI